MFLGSTENTWTEPNKLVNFFYLIGDNTLSNNTLMSEESDVTDYNNAHHVTVLNNNNNNNNNDHDDIYSAVIYGASHMQEFTVVHQGQSWSVPGGRQLVGQAANLTFESACIDCYRPNIRPSPLVLLLNHKVDTHLPSLGG